MKKMKKKKLKSMLAVRLSGATQTAYALRLGLRSKSFPIFFIFFFNKNTR